MRRTKLPSHVLPGLAFALLVSCSPDITSGRRDVTAEDAAKFLKNSDRVLGIVIEKEARAYPIFILQVHEMCNDTLAGRPIAPNF